MNKEFNRGTNTQDHWNQKHIHQYEVNKEFDYSRMGELSYIKVANDIIVQNQDSITRKSILDIGCAVGKAVNYYKINLPEWKCSGYDFSPSAIEAAKIKVPNCYFEQRDILLNPLGKRTTITGDSLIEENEEYGVITMLETIEHIEEGTNYKILDNILEHCEYCIISTVDTEDDCFGEHISHYKLDTFEKKGYEVLWKSNLDEIYMPTGIFHYIIFLIKGNLK